MGTSKHSISDLIHHSLIHTEIQTKAEFNYILLEEAAEPDHAEWPFGDNTEFRLKDREKKYARARYALLPEILDKWVFAFTQTNYCKNIALSVTKDLLDSYKKALLEEKKRGYEGMGARPYLDAVLDEKGRTLDVRIRSDIIHYVFKIIEEFISTRMVKEDIWEDLVRWNWNTSIVWAVDIMEEKYGPDHMLMEDETWANALDQVICKANLKRSTQQQEAYRLGVVQAFLNLSDFAHKTSVEMEEFLGLERANQLFLNPVSNKIMPERSGFLTTFSGLLYHQVRAVIYGKEFFTAFDQEWPTAILDTPRGSLKGIAQIKPVLDHAEVSEKELEKYRIQMQQAAMEMDDETVDVLDIISHVWLKTARHPEEMITLSADDFLRMRGLMEQKGGTGRRGGYKDEWRRRVAKHLNILKNTWISAEHQVIKEVEKTGANQRQWLKEYAVGSVIVISSLYGQVSEDGSIGSYTWRVRPGDIFARCLTGPGRQTALLSHKALNFDPYRQYLEKRATRYFAWQWRNRQRKELYMQPIRVRTIMDGIKMTLNYCRPSKTIERFEKMMDTLHEHGIINGWQYSDAYERWQEWVELKVIIEPPQTIIDHYMQIKDCKKPLIEQKRPENKPDVQQLKAERRRRQLTQLQAAEQMGINQTTLSRIEGGKTVPNREVRNRINQWLNGAGRLPGVKDL